MLDRRNKATEALDAVEDRAAFERLRDLIVQEPKRFRVAAEDGRIFPNYWAPVIHEQNGQRVITPMRYSAYPPRRIPEAAAKKLTTFNARRDNLGSPFWAEAFGRHHGLLVLRAFYEWVSVKNLLQAGVVTSAEVRAHFAGELAARKLRVEAQGKRFKATPTELKEAAFRDIVIMFAPRDDGPLLVPTIVSESHLEPGLFGCAIVTDDPAPEVLTAGHDRTPISLSLEAAKAWLTPNKKSAKDLDALLDQRPAVHFDHRLPLVA